MTKRILAVLIALELILITMILATVGILALNTPVSDTNGSGESVSTFGISGSQHLQNAAATDSFQEVIDSIVNGIKNIINGIVNLFLAPINAIVSVINNWARSLGSWYAPILAAIVIVILLFIFRLFSTVDAFLDKLNI